jgi:hypothetical protein
MTDDFEASVTAHLHELAGPRAKLFAAQRLSGDKVREQTKGAYGRLVDAHLLITGVLSAALLRVHGRMTQTDATKEESRALFASFVIGMVVCESAIEEGRYLQALALLRQEMETLAQIKAVRAGKKKAKKPPNVRVLEKSLARQYDELSAAAHVSNPHIVRAATEFDVPGNDLPGPTSGRRYFPAFDGTVARRSFTLHLALTIHLIDEFGTDLHERNTGDGFTERDVEAIELAWRLMQAEGMAAVDE